MRRAAIIQTFAAAAAIATASAPIVRAQDECGPATGNPATATCHVGSNPYPGGVYYQIDNGDLVLNADSGFVSETTITGDAAGLSVQSNVTGSVFLNAPSATIVLTNDLSASFRNGMRATSASGDVFVDTGAGIAVAAQFAQGIVAIAGGDLSSVVYHGPHINVGGPDSSGIYTGNTGTGDAKINASGNVTALDTDESGQVTSGVFAWTLGGGNASVRFRSGTVSVIGPSAYGVAAVTYAGGSAQVVADVGTVVTVSGPSTPSASPNAFSVATFGGTAAANNFVSADIASRIETSGPGTPFPAQFFNPNGIDAESDLDAPITVNYHGPGITTAGGGGFGILALSGSGSIDIVSSGPITTNGTIGQGIFADSGLAVHPFGSPVGGPPLGPVRGAPAPLAGIGGPISIRSTGAIITNGSEANGIWANSTTDAVTIIAGDTSTRGDFSSGIRATGGGFVTVNVLAGSVVSGGWQADPSAVGSRLLLPASGVAIGSHSSGATLLNNFGTVDALSDLAIAEADLFLAGFGPQQLTINNAGTIIGYLRFGAGNALFNNTSSHSLDLRDFEDTNGDGIRDTERVVVSDFGAGTDQFNNEATGAVRLLTVLGATTANTAGQFLPDGSAVHDMAQTGVEQGQMLNLELFENSGLITMQDQETGGSARIAGDVLVITGSGTAAVADGGVFLSDGGALHLDTVLNQGGAASISDILVVDTTQTGPGGATRIAIANAGGAGALTAGDGIKVVDVLDPANSDASAFTLGSRAVAGPYEYFLFQGGVADPGNGDWYLRSNGVLRPEIPAYLGNARAAMDMFQHTLHERLGEPQYTDDARPADGSVLPAFWLRTFGRHSEVDPHDAFGFDADTDTWLVQGGLDLAQWSLFTPGADRFHIGVMAGYGESNVNARAIGNPNRAKGETDGYSFGAYATWYQDDARRLGLYLDGWLQYGIFDNKVRGDLVPVVSYGSDVLTTSLEAGYAFRPDDREPLVFEPQAQLVYLNFDQDGVVDASETHVAAEGDGIWITRLGVRVHGTWSDADTRYQPYFELNWWHDGDGEQIALNGLKFEDGVPDDRCEVGFGLNVEIAANTALWANAEYQFGDAYEAIEGLLGVKYAW